MTIKDDVGSRRVPTADELPFPGYDALSPAALRQRVLTVDEDGVSALLMYERRHANRAQMVDVLERRLTSLRTWPAALSMAHRRSLRQRLRRRQEVRHSPEESRSGVRATWSSRSRR